jgi:hypothetical protein
MGRQHGEWLTQTRLTPGLEATLRMDAMWDYVGHSLWSWDNAYMDGRVVDEVDI